MAAGLDAQVDLLDKNVDRLRMVDQIQMGRVTTLTSNRGQVERVVEQADLVIGAVLVAGGRAPVLVDEDLVKAMKDGAVLVDIAIDQGGCIATSHETSHHDPVFEAHGVIHYAVGNMPGAVPHTSTYALTNVTLPYLAELARLGVRAACHADPVLALGVNTLAGAVPNEVVAAALGRPHRPLEELLGPT
jgi:alanine dehydrogenase